MTENHIGRVHASSPQPLVRAAWDSANLLVDCPACGKTGLPGCFCTTCKTKLPDTWVYTAAQKAKDRANWREPFSITWARLGNFSVGPAFDEWDAA